MRLAVDQVAVNLRLKCLAHLARGTGELDGHPPGMDLVHGQPVRLQPGGHGGHIRVVWTIETTKFFRCQPLMKGGIAGRVRDLDVVPERRLLRRGAIEQQQHAADWQPVIHRALVGYGLGQSGAERHRPIRSALPGPGLDHGTQIAVQNDARGVIDGT